MLQEDQNTTKIFTCTQCPKVFATRSNLKRHMENPNIHNIPYVRSRDQKRWKGHSKRIVSKEETTERMRKWRAENREKNRQNDLRCRVYRLARQKFGDHDSLEKQGFVREEISRRLGRRMMLEKKDTVLVELPFYSAPQQKIELPSIQNLTSPSWSNASSPLLPHLSPTLERRSSSSSSSVSSITSDSQIKNKKRRRSNTPTQQEAGEAKEEDCVLPSMHTFLSYASPVEQQQKQQCCIPTKAGIKYVESNKILDEFVGVVLNYVDNTSI